MLFRSSDWRATKTLQALCAREAESYLRVFAEFGVQPLSVEKDAGEFAFRINWRVPENWSTDDIERFEDALVAAQDPMPAPATADDDGLSAEEIWGHWSPPARPVPDHEAPVVEVCGVPLNHGEAEEFEAAKDAGVLVVGPWSPLNSRVPEAWRRWCEQEHRPHVVREVKEGRGDEPGEAGAAGAA